MSSWSLVIEIVLLGIAAQRLRANAALALLWSC